MTYIKIDSNFVDLNILSRLLNLSESQIEKVIDLGFAGPSSHELSSETKELNEVMSKIKLGAHLVSLGIPDEISLTIYEAYKRGSNYEGSLKELYQDGKLEMSQFINLMNW